MPRVACYLPETSSTYDENFALGNEALRKAKQSYILNDSCLPIPGFFPNPFTPQQQQLCGVEAPDQDEAGSNGEVLYHRAKEMIKHTHLTLEVIFHLGCSVKSNPFSHCSSVLLPPVTCCSQEFP